MTHFGSYGLPPHVVSRVKELYATGLSVKRVAEATGQSPATIRKALIKAGVPLRSRSRTVGEPTISEATTGDRLVDEIQKRFGVRLDTAGRVVRYVELRDSGLESWAAARELGLSTGSADRYERWRQALSEAGLT